MTRKPVKSGGGMEPLYGTAVIVVSGALSFFFISSFFGPEMDCLALILTAIVSLGIITAYSLRAAKQQSRAVRVYHYECQYCRNKWSWQEGTPIPRHDRQREIQQDYQEVFGSATTDDGRPNET